MKSRALGRGLDALFGEVGEAYDNEGSQRESVLDISVKDIKANPYQPRKHFDEETLLELSESIKEDGLIQPIVVVEDESDGYVLIAGERRFRATKLAKLKTIRAIVLNTDEYSMRKFALIENIQREELNAIELANAYSELLNHQNITQEELATTVHKSRTHITNTIRLLQLSTKTQKALLDKKVTAGHAKVLVGLDEKEQQVIVNSIIGQKLSVREVEAMIKNIKNLKPAIVDQILKKEYDFSTLQEKFHDLGFKSKISNNKLVIEFEDETQITNMLNWFA
jgi:ParB family transcriptional regulator, chromosome partitioning protein